MMREASWGVLLATLLVTLWACRTTAFPVAPGELGEVKVSGQLSVETLDGTLVRIKPDSVSRTVLFGKMDSGEPKEVPLGSIRSVFLEERDVSAVVALVPAAAVWAFLTVQTSQAGEKPPPEPKPPTSGSCPFVYAFDGEQFVFQAEPYGAAIAPALQRTEWTLLPDLKAVDGKYLLRIANVMDETQHTDEARLVVVDHPRGSRVFADPFGEFHLFRASSPPELARSSQGEDLTTVLRDVDARAWMSGYGAMDAKTRETLRDPLILEFEKPADAQTVRLLVNGATSLWGAQVAEEFLALHGRRLPEWYAELDNGGAALFRFLAWFAREGLYSVPIEVETVKGWQSRGTLLGSGPLAYRNTAYLLDVSDVVGETLRIRFPVPVNFWVFNSVAADFGVQPELDVLEIQTTTDRDAKGRPVGTLLSETDGRALVMPEKGDHFDIGFPAPPRRPGRDRTVFLKISGHYEIHLPAEGDPQEAVFRRVSLEPGYTLQFAFERFQEIAVRAGLDPRR